MTKHRTVHPNDIRDGVVEKYRVAIHRRLCALAKHNAFCECPDCELVVMALLYLFLKYPDDYSLPG